MTYTCQHCGWTWVPRPAALKHGPKPVACPNPKCGRRDWERE